MSEQTNRVILTVGRDAGKSGLDLVNLCTVLDQRLRVARPEIDWQIGANLEFGSTTIKVEPDWPANYAEVQEMVSPLFDELVP
jgi:hypothetical protein